MVTDVCVDSCLRTGLLTMCAVTVDQPAQCAPLCTGWYWNTCSTFQQVLQESYITALCFYHRNWRIFRHAVALVCEILSQTQDVLQASDGLFVYKQS